jgi:hypothetical protein
LGVLGATGLRLFQDEQTRVDAHLVHVLGDLQGDLDAVVVDIGHQRHRLVGLDQLAPNRLHRLGMGHAGNGNPHDLRARLVQTTDGRHRRIDVESVFVDHGLHHHRVLAADQHVAYGYGAGRTTGVDRFWVGLLRGRVGPI